MKLRVAWRNIVHYIRNDLREIAFPSSLPDPPSAKLKPKPRKLTAREHLQVWRTATRLYIQSWRTGTLDDEEEEDHESKQPKKESQKEPSVLEDLAIAARAGSEHLRPALQRVYMTRASAYRDALKSFVQGYQEGLREVKETSQDLKDLFKREEPYPQSGEARHQTDVAPRDQTEISKDPSQRRNM